MLKSLLFRALITVVIAAFMVVAFPVIVTSQTTLMVISAFFLGVSASLFAAVLLTPKVRLSS